MLAGGTPDMRTVLHVSRSLHSILSLVRFISSTKNSGCIPLLGDALLNSNGEYPQCNRPGFKAGFCIYKYSDNDVVSAHGRWNPGRPSLARESSLGAEFRAFRKSVRGSALARGFSSGTEFSDSDWIETDDEQISSFKRHVGTLSHRNRHSPGAVGRDTMRQKQHGCLETNSEPDTDNTPRSQQKWLGLRPRNHGRVGRVQQVSSATESDSYDDMDRNLSESFGNDDENDNISVGLDKTESETDDDVVTDMSDSVEIEDTDEDTSVGLCEAEGDKVSSIASSKARDLSHLKKSPYDRSRLDRRPPVRPSKKERSAGLSPRTIRDDDSDDIEIESDLEGELQEEIKREMEAEPKFRRPSVTWGILLSKEHREAAREVIKYLETEGIDTNMLKQIELPTAVEVMQTRLGFLRKIGLDNEAINNYPLVLGCSVYKNMVPVLKYLKKLGFPQHWVSILVRKYPMILHASVVIDILPVIYFLRGLDIDLVDIPRVLTRYPDLLGFKTEGTMSTSVAYLVSVGVGVRHVGYMLTEYPEILGMRVATVIKPKFDYLMSLGIPQTIVARIIERRPYILGYHLESRMQSNVNHLLEIGVRKEAIPGMIAQFPDILGRILSVSAKDHASWFKDKLMLETDKVAGMIEKMPQVILIPTEMALERIRFLKSQHFTTADIGQMVSQCPQILISSIFSTLRPNLNFLTSEMKRLHTDVVDFPEYFTYSLEGRIKPRFRALTNGDRDLNCSLDWLLNCSDLEFEKRLDGRSDVVDEMVGPSFIMGGQLPGKPEKAKDESHSSEAYEAAAL